LLSADGTVLFLAEAAQGLHPAHCRIASAVEHLQGQFIHQQLIAGRQLPAATHHGGLQFQSLAVGPAQMGDLAVGVGGVVGHPA
jgi:hypothetical protein